MQKLIRVRAVEGAHLGFLDRDDKIWAGRWVGWDSLETRSAEPAEVHECQYYRDAINRGELEEVTAPPASRPRAVLSPSTAPAVVPEKS